MMPLITDLETIVVNNEIESLMLEGIYIKQFLPKFNILLTDDKSYPYIKLILNESIPRFTIVRKRLNDKARYFGPYLSARSAQYTLEFLRQLYGIHFSASRFPCRERACLNCQLDGFTCPLAGEVSDEKYQERVRAAVDFLEGKRGNLVKELESAMYEASANKQFERAAKLRNRLHSVKHIRADQRVISSNLEDYDAIGCIISGSIACIALLKVREGQITNQQSFFYNVTEGTETGEVIGQFLTSLYTTFADIPHLVSISDKIENRETVERLLENIFLKKVEIRIPQRGDKKDLTALAVKNALSKINTRLLKSDQTYIGLIALKEVLNLNSLPTRIEAVDISNLGTSEPVGATVCFINGQPDKNEYRRYKIKTVEGQNDFAMIREVVKRRFSDTSRTVPDLFVVDGGPEQLKFAVEGIEQSPLAPKYLISLAKKPDRIFLPNKKRPVLIPRGNKGLMMLSNIRDEVHRFGITFHRTRQRKKLLRSVEA